MCKYTCSLLHSLIQDFLCLSLHSLSSIVQFSSGYQRCTLDTFISAFYSGHFHMYLTLIKSKSISIQQLTVPVRCWLMGHLTHLVFRSFLISPFFSPNAHILTILVSLRTVSNKEQGIGMSSRVESDRFFMFLFRTRELLRGLHMFI